MTSRPLGPEALSVDGSGTASAWWPSRAVPMLGGLLVLFLPFGRIGQFRVAGFPMSVSKVVAIGLVAALGTEWLRHRSRPSTAVLRSWFRSLDRGGQAAVVGVLALTVGLVLRPDALLGHPVPFLQLLSSLALVPLIAVSWPRLSRRQQRAIAMAMAASTLVLMLATVDDTVIYNHYGATTTRFGGTLSDPNDWAGVLIAVLAILWASASELVGRGTRFAVAAMGAGLGATLILTQSRGGLVAVVAAAAAYAVLAGGRRGRQIALATALVAVVVVVGLRAADGGPFADSIAARRILALPGEDGAEIVDGESVQTRRELMEATADTFLERPVTGHGAGTFLDAVDYRRADGLIVDSHNTVGVAAVEHGILGLVGALLLVVPGLFWMARGPTVTCRRLAAGFFALWIMSMTIDLLDNTYIWIMLGLLMAETSPVPAQASSTST